MNPAAKRIVRYRQDQAEWADLRALCANVKYNRHIAPDMPIELSLNNLFPFESLKNIDAASVLLADHVMAANNICVIGDFDTDGATSTALAVSALQAFGAGRVDFLVPNRFAFGYGLTPEIVDVALSYEPRLIITVDNGIASIAGVARANELGMQVLITDHHLQGKELPAAAAIINPNQKGDLFPSKNLAGVGVIFYLMMALRQVLRRRGWFENQTHLEPNLAQFLDLVALGTVADVVPLDHNNRILVQQGLLRIRAGQCRLGISALIALGKKHQKKIAATDLGFIVAPRLNAAGRMEDMSLGIACLLAKTKIEAESLACRLDLLNQERRAVEADMQQDAYAALEKLSFAEQVLPYGICLFQDHWHQGVIGIVAARIKDRFARPVIAFAQVNDHELKGSGRSVSGIHIRDVLDHIATEYPGLLTKFGGHAMAAGLSLALADYDTFSFAFNQTVQQFLGERTLDHVLYSDGGLSPGLLQLSTAEALQELGPYGQGFPEPLFDGIFELIDQCVVGGRHLKLLLKARDSAQFFKAIAFNVDERAWPNYQATRAHIAYRLDVNEFKDQRSVQLIVEYLEAC